MDLKLLNRLYAFGVFLISLIVLFSTVQPSLSFWDCGEFAAAAYAMQVPHPPGTPFFLLIGRIFSMIPFADNIAFRINTVSVIASAASIIFLYLIIVKLIENYRGKVYKNTFDAIITFTSAAIGALAFSFSDTFWFNGVEAEVYATSTFLLAAITYLMVLWNEKADNPDNEKYILMIAYLIGLSTGVHLMSVLAIISVVMTIMFRKYVDDDEALKKSAYILLGNIALLLLIAFALWGAQTTTTPPSQAEYEAFDLRFVLIMGGITVLIIGAFWKKLIDKNSIYLTLIIGGIALFVTYPGVVKVLPGIMKSVAGDNIVLELILLAFIFSVLGYGVYYSIKNKKPTLHLVSMSLIFIVLGFTTYSMVIIRANMDTPMNQNQPDDFTELVSYLGREQYGDFPIFKRRFSMETHQQQIYTNYSSDLSFWWNYQMHHMKTRYLLWNFAGRESWDQDAGANIWPFNSIGNALGKIINIRFAGGPKDSLYGIPLLLGLLGIYFHFRKDWKTASIFMVLFIFMGYLTAFYQNQQEPQPRERDYFYVGAFFVFAIWIGIAVRALSDIVIEKVTQQNAQRFAVIGLLALGVGFVPAKMLHANYFQHDRSLNFVPWDYAYNLLQSCEPNAVLFTNGDNDTFPLWYLQDVEGVRRDVRVVNLSLANTSWYIKQAKNLEPHGAEKVAMRFTDAQVDQLQPIQFDGADISVPVPLSVFKEFGITDTSITNRLAMTWRKNPTVNYGGINAIRVQDMVVREIIESNQWRRPIYFAVTTGDDSKIGLTDFLRMEGMALRVVPFKQTPGVEFLNEPVHREQLFNEPEGYNVNYQPGFKFRGLNNPNIFFDENHERLTQNYRNSFIRLALYYAAQREDTKVIETLDMMESKIPRSVIEMDHRLLFDVGNVYRQAGAIEKYLEIAKDVEVYALKALELNPTDVSSFYNPYRLLLDIYEFTKQYDKSIDLLNKVKTFSNDPSIDDMINRLKMQKAEEDSIKK